MPEPVKVVIPLEDAGDAQAAMAKKRERARPLGYVGECLEEEKQQDSIEAIEDEDPAKEEESPAQGLEEAPEQEELASAPKAKSERKRPVHSALRYSPPSKNDGSEVPESHNLAHTQADPRCPICAQVKNRRKPASRADKARREMLHALEPH